MPSSAFFVSGSRPSADRNTIKQKPRHPFGPRGFSLLTGFGLRLLEVPGTNAGSAGVDGADRAAIVHADALNVGTEGALDILHNVQTDTTGLLGKTSASDAAADHFALAANGANLAHFFSPGTGSKIPCHIYVIVLCFQKWWVDWDSNPGPPP